VPSRLWRGRAAKLPRRGFPRPGCGGRSMKTSFIHHVAQQIGTDATPRRWLIGARLGAHYRDAHKSHQPPERVAIDRTAAVRQQPRHPARAQEGLRSEQLVLNGILSTCCSVVICSGASAHDNRQPARKRSRSPHTGCDCSGVPQVCRAAERPAGSPVDAAGKDLVTCCGS
jgi:hypothetical protein